MRAPQPVEAVFQYPRPDLPDGSLWVYPVVAGGPTETGTAAEPIVDTLIDAYSGRFAVDSPLALTPDDVARHFHTKWPTPEDYASHMEVDTRVGGSQFWLASVRDPRDTPPQDTPEYQHYRAGEHIVGFAKTTPSRPRLMVMGPNVFVNDIDVRTDVQRQGIGRTLLHALLRFGGYSPSRLIATELFRDPPIELKLIEAGLRYIKPAETFKITSGETGSPCRIAQARFASGRGQSIGSTLAWLEERTPPLVSPEQLPLQQNT